MDTKWLQPAVLRSAVRNLLQSMFLAAWLLGPQASAQDVRFEYGGQAHTYSEERSALLTAISRQVLGEAPADWGHIVFFRPHPGGTMLQLQGDQARLGELSGGTYVVVAVAPGAHDFGAEGANGLRLQVAPGQAYFVRASGGTDDEAPSLREVDIRSFDRASQRLVGL